MPGYSAPSSRASGSGKKRKLARILAEKEDKTILWLSGLGAREAVRVVDIGVPLGLRYVAQLNESLPEDVASHYRSDFPSWD